MLDAAEGLFARKGYASVTLRDIAAEVGIRHASLYHHAPDGKEQLYVEVTERNLERHYAGLTAAITDAAPEARARLRAAADWLLSQPPMDLVRMVHVDMPAIGEAHATRLAAAAFRALLLPIAGVLEEARQSGEIGPRNLDPVPGGFIGLIGSLHAVPESVTEYTRQEMARQLIDVLLDGLRPRD